MVNRLETLSRESCHEKVSSSVWALIEACVDSANKSLKILSAMHDKNVLRESRLQGALHLRDVVNGWALSELYSF